MDMKSDADMFFMGAVERQNKMEIGVGRWTEVKGEEPKVWRTNTDVGGQRDERCFITEHKFHQGLLINARSNQTFDKNNVS